MGADVSRELLDPARTLNDLLEDEELQLLIRHSAWPEASETSRKFLSDLTQPPRDRLRSLFDGSLSFELSTADLDILHGLADGYVANVTARLSTQGPQAYYNIESAISIKTPTFTDHIARRLQLCIFYTLREYYDRTRPGAFAHNIASGNETDVRKINTNVRYWARSGSLLQRSANDLGGLGILLVLPSSVSRSIWESHLSPNAARYQDAVDHLLSRGLGQFAAHHRADEAINNILGALGIEQDHGYLTISSARLS